MAGRACSPRDLLPDRAPPDHRHAGRGRRRGEALPPPPPPGSRVAFLDRWEGGADADADALPPPPPLGYSRLFVDPPRGSSPGADTQGTRVNVPLPPAPPPVTLRPERVVYRLESDSSPRSGSGRSSRASSPSASATLWSPPPSPFNKRRRSPPPRSPSPGPPKRLRRYWHAGGRVEFTGHRPSDGPASSNGQDITQSKGLMTYKHFIQALEDDVSPHEAGRRYQEYKTAYITTQKRAYFDLHKDETWLKEKYHPTNLLSVIERRNEFCKAAAKNFIIDLRSGTLDIGPEMTAGGASKSGNDNDGSYGNAEDYGNKRRKKGRGHLKVGPLSTAPKAHPVSSKYRRIQTDIDQTLALVQKLDAEKGIVGNILSSGGDHGKADLDRSNVGSTGPIVIVHGLTTVKGLDGVELLDTLLTYLWRIHGVDYYGMSEREDANGFRHVRADKKTASAFDISAADWEKQLDSFWHERLVNGDDPLVVLTANDKIYAATLETLELHVKKIMDENRGCKYGCGAKGCGKVFHAPEFVQKHLKLKHPDLVSVLTSGVQDDIYCQNYMNDPNAPGGVPVMQQPEQESNRMRRMPDEQIVGAIDVQGSDAPFVPEFSSSPLLIPVCGAGPFGPFVPVRRDMAIQMMREQRPPRPNGARGRKECLMPVPMMPMYPYFPRNPRVFRSYEDLDAPGEEVTPIDYRSM
ncbi:serrate RNA effector molecule isoform X2 [Lolium perenne]|uniref:serrate RNA effector molecule isoform X2 n=1 Tax=Lolium perenne TaxID=4522 RepID=UPI0021F56F9B|nr:serrate RNA effector molecule-like isoform X2 [Lolium perenne]